MHDTYTDWRAIADGNLTATETSAAIELGPAPIAGHDVAINVPARNADADTLVITFTQSATLGGSYATFLTLATITGTQVAAGVGGGIKRAAQLQNTLPFVRIVLTVAGATPDFGDVSAGVDAGVRANVLTIGD